MEQRKYTSIVRMGHRDTVGVVKEGDYITVYEKLDGANASFSLSVDGEVLAFSRNTQALSREQPTRILRVYSRYQPFRANAGRYLLRRMARQAQS